MAVNGKDGLEKIRKKMPDVLLLDIMMPVMNGYQVLEALKADPATRDLPVLVISAVDEMDSVLQCIKNGAEDYLPKPLNMLLLKARIGAILDRVRAREREERLHRESEARIRLIVETALEAVIVADNTGRIVIWNPQAAIAFGYTAAEVTGKPLSSIVFNPAVARYVRSRLGATSNRQALETCSTEPAKQPPCAKTAARSPLNCRSRSRRGTS